MIREIFQDSESARSGLFHVPSQPALLPPFRDPGGMLSRSVGMLIRNDKQVSLEQQKAQKEDRYLRGRQIAYLIYVYFQVIGSNDSVENYADLLTIAIRNDDFQEFDSKWDGILLSMT